MKQALRRADRVASFSGPMRRNLVAMLDAVGVADSLDINSCDDLFGSRHELAAHLSALAFPVFLNGQNYSGGGITLIPQLVVMIRQILAAQLRQAGEALVVPLGRAASEAVEVLVDDGSVAANRCLLGFPHPSGANGHRKQQFASLREQLTAGVRRWSDEVLQR